MTGCLFQRNGHGNWYMKFYDRGKAVVQSSKTSNERTAAKMLRKRIAEIEAGMFSGTKMDRVKMRELFADYKQDQEIEQCSSQDDSELRWKTSIEPVFGHLKASSISTSDIRGYITSRLALGMQPATVNRELAILKRMFTLAVRATPPKAARSPHFPMLKENNVRTGFIEDDKYSALAAASSEVGLWLRGIFETGYWLGWRLGEIKNLQVKNYDTVSGRLCLFPGATKNGDGRVAHAPQVLKSILDTLVAGKAADEYVFTRNQKNSRVLDFRRSWAAICIKAGVPDLLFHDLRRTAIRNMLRSGTDQQTAMKITGHRTASIFARYNITSERDLQRAAQTMNDREISTVVYKTGVTAVPVPPVVPPPLVM